MKTHLLAKVRFLNVISYVLHKPKLQKRLCQLDKDAFEKKKLKPFLRD